MPDRNPTNEPKPAFIASLESFPDKSSPTTAPRNGPKIIHSGGKNSSPASNPITLPQTPKRDAPKVLAPHTGIQ